MLIKIWAIFGIILVLSELIIPGAVVVFLGISALLVSFTLWTGWIEGIIPSLILWFISSLFLILLLRSLAMRFIPGETEIQNTDEDLDAIGAEVLVIETVGPNQTGRIRFRGTTWEVDSKDNKEITAGSRARIISRNNIKWVIESLIN